MALVDEVGKRFAAEGRVPAQKRVRDHAERPHVDGFAVPLLEHDLGCGVAEGSGHRGEDFVLGIEHLGDAKVGEDEGGVIVVGKIEEILWFEIYGKAFR